MELALGTVQFGLNYGVSNQLGKVSNQQITEILSFATQNSINTLDTANAYGDSEQLLGKLASPDFEIVTKINPINASHVSSLFAQSLEHLKRTSINAVMLHDADVLTTSEGHKIAKALLALKTAGKVNKVGVSLYHPEQLQLFESLMPDIVQVPVNLLDQRFASKQILDVFTQNQIEVHARSAFLQGLLLMKPEDRAAYFDNFNELAKFDEFIQFNSANRLEICLSFLKSIEQIDKVVIGCCSVEQLSEIVKTWQQATALNLTEFASNNVALVVPSNWQLK